MRFQAERGLNQGSQTGNSAGMTDISLGAADVAGIFCLFSAEKLTESFCLKGVFRSQATAMGFQVADRFRSRTGFKAGPFQREGISVTVRKFFFDLPAGCGSEPLDDGIDMITILLGVVEALENDRSSALTDQ